MEHGQQLPTVRVLADHYGVSTRTIHNAYRTLAAESVIVITPGLGNSPRPRRPRALGDADHRTKTEPAVEDMLTQLRRTLITARISAGTAAQPTAEQTRAVLAAWHAAAA